MSHHTARGGYHDLMVRLNKFPQGAPPSELLFKIFAILFSEEEAHLLSRLPLRPFPAAKAAKIWQTPEKDARKRLENLASRGVLVDIEHNGAMLYILPPPMAGFFEFSLMRVRGDIDQKELSRLFFRYINVEEDFVRDLFAAGETSLGRVLVNEPALSPDDLSQVLDYEKATEVIRTASHIAVGLCYCRHKMAHMGRACDAPQDNCLTLNRCADYLIRHGVARGIEVSEGLDILQQARSCNLVQCADNVQRGVNFICNCCGCCCEAMIAVRRLAIPNAMYTTNFIATSSQESCSGCGNCTRICPIEAITLAPVSEEGRALRRAEVNEDFCLGCGVCVRNCPTSALRLEARSRRIMTPINTAHRLVVMAIERGKLQNLIFDNQAYLTHRAMAAVLGAILRLPPVHRLMASKQLKSRYLERVMADIDIDTFSS